MPECKKCGQYCLSLEKHQCPLPENLSTKIIESTSDDSVNIIDQQEYPSTEDHRDKMIDIKMQKAGEVSGSGVGKKWFLFGIGGAGCHVLDSIILRQHYVKSINNEYLTKIWDAAIGEYVLFDTNTADIASTFIAKEIKRWDQHSLDSFCRIGAECASGDEDYSEIDDDATGVGAGGWRIAGEKAMQYTIDNEDQMESRIGQGLINKMRSVQAIMLIHSTTNGTGCGATPVLANHIRKVLAPKKIVYSMTVLPAIGEISMGVPGRNAFIGLANVVKSVNGVILTDNNALYDKKFCTVDFEPLIHEQPEYHRYNRNIVEFLEAFSLSSSLGNTNAKGAMFDVKDAVRLAKLNQQNRAHAPILVPVHGSLKTNSNFKVDKNSIAKLFINTIIGGKLACCDHTKAKGGTFVIAGSKEIMVEKGLAKIIKNTTLVTDVINRKEFLNGGEIKKDARIYPLILPNIEDVRMWGFLWNPPLKLVDVMMDNISNYLKASPNTEEKFAIQNSMDVVEEVYKDLGRYELDD